MHFHHVIIGNATIEEEMEEDGAMYVNIREKSTLQLVGNYFRKNVPLISINTWITVKGYVSRNK